MCFSSFLSVLCYWNPPAGAVQKSHGKLSLNFWPCPETEVTRWRNSLRTFISNCTDKRPRIQQIVSCLYHHASRRLSTELEIKTHSRLSDPSRAGAWPVDVHSGKQHVSQLPGGPPQQEGQEVQGRDASSHLRNGRPSSQSRATSGSSA